MLYFYLLYILGTGLVITWRKVFILCWSVIEGRLGDNGAWWSIDTNATEHTNQRGLGEKHDILRLSCDPDIHLRAKFFCAIIDTFYVNNCNYIFFLLNIVIQKKSVKNISGKSREYLKRLPAYVKLAVAKREIVSKRCTKRTPEEWLLLGGSSHFLTVEHPLG